jgi:hypothetical protein
MRVTPVLLPALLFLTISAFAQAPATQPKPQTPQDLTLKTGSNPPVRESNSAADTNPPALKPEPKLSDSEMELFLRTANVVAQKKLESGTTGATRATLSDGKLTHDAQFQPIDIYKPVFRGAEGTVEKNFRDSYKFNIAAFRLGRMVSVNNIPMSVERELDGKIGSMTWWLDNIWITEAERRDRGIKPPASQFWVDELNTVRVFDQLIYNTDRNQGNLLITPDWKVWMIDHTRAFRTMVALQKKNALPGRIDHKVLRALRQLNTLQLKKELGAYLRPEEISAILGRRDLIVAHFDREISTKGEDLVLTGMPRKTPEVSLP